MARRAQKYTVKPKKSHKKITSIGVAGYKPDGRWHSSSRNLSHKQADQHNRGLKAIGDTHFLKYDSRLGSSWQHGMFEEGGHGYGADDYDKDDEDGGDWEDIVQRILRTVKGERKRKKDGVRMALAKNWERIEAWMASYQLHRFEEVTPCDCKGFYDVEVNMISFACKPTISLAPKNVLTRSYSSYKRDGTVLCMRSKVRANDKSRNVSIHPS